MRQVHPSNCLQLFRRRDLIACLGLFFAVLFAQAGLFGQDCTQLRDQVVRLHILANSDSAQDQQQKLLVRDRILEETGQAFQAPQTRQQALLTARQQLPIIERAARDALQSCGSDDAVHVELCRMYFTTRQYGDLYLPAGEYDAVRVTIGEGAGHNWWCVLYPPMCVSAAIDPDTPAFQQIDQLNHQPLFYPKLALVEWAEQLFGHSEPKNGAAG